MVSPALKNAQKIYRKNNKEKLKEKQRIYSNNYYNKNKDICKERQRRKYDFKREWQLLCKIEI